MRIYRLSLPKFVDTAFSGQGALLVGGRWTPPGYRAIYTAGSIALAVLETLVHAPLPTTPSHFAITIDVPDSMRITAIEPDTLPDEWRGTPAPPSLQKIGESWLQSFETAILRVPSAIVPQEPNYILNPLHTAFSQLVIHEADPFKIDGRLFRLS